MMSTWRLAATLTLASAATGTGLLWSHAADAQLSFSSREDQVLPGRGAAAVVAADLLGDPSLDLVVTFAASGEVAILQNDGTGTFALADPGDLLADPDPDGMPTQVSAVSDDPGGVQVVDLNGDGRLDVVGVNRMGTPRFFTYLNNADGSIDPGQPRWIASDTDASGGEGFDLTVTDWPNPADANPDLVIATATGQVKIVLGLGAGEFDTRLIFSATGDVGVLTDVEVDDFLTADPMLDVLTVDNNIGQLVIWPGDPSLPGSLLDDQLVFVPTEVGGETVLPIEAFVDEFTGDGIADALVVTEQGHALFFPGDGTPAAFGAPTVTDLVAPLSADPMVRMPTMITSAAYEDVNGDGIRDLVIADSGDRGAAEGFNWLSIYRGCMESPEPVFDVDGSACGAPPLHHAAADLAPDRPFGVAVADLDGDGATDVALPAGDAPTMTVYRGDGAGGFVDAARSYSIGGTLARGLGASDFNGDGIADVAVGVVGLQTIDVLTGDGAGGFATSQSLPASGATSPSGVLVGSFNPDVDATPDVLATFSGEHALWEGDGAGFTGPTSLPIAGTARAGEVGGSAATDLVTAVDSPSGRTVTRWVNDGAGAFTDVEAWENLFGYKDHAVGSFFGSSRDDIVVFARGSATPTDPEGVWILRHDSGADAYMAPVFQEYGDIDPILDGFFSARSTAVGDLDGDGGDELVVAAGSGIAVVFEPNGSGGFQLTPSSATGIDLIGAGQSLLLADLTGDGDAELVGAARSRVVIVEGSSGSSFLDGAPVTLRTNIDNDRVRAGDLTGDGLLDLIVSSSSTSDVTVFINRSTPPLRLRLGRPLAQDALHWPDVGAAEYDVVRGDLWVLRTDLGVDGAAMLACDLMATETSDPAAAPAPPGTAPAGAWGAWYYLLRCQGGDCTDSTYGTDSTGNARTVGAGDCP